MHTIEMQSTENEFLNMPTHVRGQQHNNCEQLTNSDSWIITFKRRKQRQTATMLDLILLLYLFNFLFMSTTDYRPAKHRSMGNEAHTGHSQGHYTQYTSHRRPESWTQVQGSNQSTTAPHVHTSIHTNCGGWWLIGRFDAFRPKGRRFESRMQYNTRQYTLAYLGRFRNSRPIASVHRSGIGCLLLSSILVLAFYDTSSFVSCYLSSVRTKPFCPILFFVLRSAVSRTSPSI